MYDVFSLQNGFLSALPHLCLWWFSIPWGWFADFLIRSGRLSQQSVRKLSNNVGMLGPSLGLLCLAYAKCDKTFTIFSLCFSCALYGALYSGYQVNLSLLVYIMHGCFRLMVNQIISLHHIEVHNHIRQRMVSYHPTMQEQWLGLLAQSVIPWDFFLL